MQFRFTSFALCLLLSGTAGLASAQTSTGEVDASFLATASSRSFHATPHDLTNGQAHHRFGIAGIDSIPNFNGQFFTDGIDANGFPNRHWYTNTVGNPPQQGGTTLIHAPVQPVSVELDDVNGNLVTIDGHPLISDATQFVQPTLNSPVFSTAIYTSGADATQFSDAIQRAEFFNSAKPDWHTLLVPAPLPAITMHIRQSANCSGPFFFGCNYLFLRNADGSCCEFILADQIEFQQGLDSVLAADVANNSIHTKDISTFLYPNTFLFEVHIPELCCILGFHTYDTVPQASNTPEQRFVFNYSSWVSPGLLGSIQDVTTLSHEISETYNDPFVVSDGVHNLTPWYLAPNGNCQDNLESGDAIENLPDAVFPITVNNYLYHPQNEALIQWFEFESPSSALAGAYSYPDPSALPQLSAPQRFFCQ